jgi:serine/threonine protein kinase
MAPGEAYMKIPESVPWKCVRTLGQGGQSRVIEVVPRTEERLLSGQQVVKNVPIPDGRYVLKELKRPEHTQALARFAREIEAIKRVTHPSVVRIIDHSVEGDEYQYYVMPYSEGARTLEDIAFADDSPFRGHAKETLLFVAKCAGALYEVHRREIVHRDIKPRNILVLPDRSPLIIDFGCCHVADGGAVTLVDEAVGAQNYMAPECEAGAEGKVSVRSDIYSLGKVMWAIVTGQRAFARESPCFSHKSIEEILKDRPETWHLTELLKQSVRRDPEKRFGNMENFGKECARYAQEVVGIVLPMALVPRRCPLCGATEIVASDWRIEEPLVDMRLLISNPANHPDLTGCLCRRCGYVFLRNLKPHKVWEAERGRLAKE